MRRAALFGMLVVSAAALWSAGCVVYTRDPSAARPPPPPSGEGPRVADVGRPPPPPPPRPMASTPPQPGPVGPEGMEDLGPPLPAGDVIAPPPPQPDYQEPPEATTNPELLPPGVAGGRPPGFRPGAPAGFWIWQGPRGSWLLRTTTTDALHQFRGRISGLTGDIVNVHPLRTEFRDRIRRGSKGAWAFSFATQSHADGFTFMTSDGGCARFDLQLDGTSQPKRVFVGRGELQPRSGHFVVCPPGKGPPPPPPPPPR